MKRRLEIGDSAKALGVLVDDTQTRLNHSHENIGGHPLDATALRIQHAGGRREAHAFGTWAPAAPASWLPSWA